MQYPQQTYVSEDSAIWAVLRHHKTVGTSELRGREQTAQDSRQPERHVLVKESIRSRRKRQRFRSNALIETVPQHPASEWCEKDTIPFCFRLLSSLVFCLYSRVLHRD